MKLIYTFALAALNLLATNVLAQKDEMQLGSHFLASEATEIPWAARSPTFKPETPAI